MRSVSQTARRVGRRLADVWRVSSLQKMVSPSEAFPGRSVAIVPAMPHAVLATPLAGPFPPGSAQAIFAMGCFWGAERLFWKLDGVYTTAVGYSGGFTPNPTYEEVCSAKTGHAESVLVVYDPAKMNFASLLAAFFEGHDPTQHMRQGHDVGTQYRSAIFATNAEQQAEATAVRDRYGALLEAAGFGAVATEIAAAGPFFYAEAYHQQYLANNPWGYCGLGSTGVACPSGRSGSVER
jgi:peptide-methionine (S)-S-oxide reductase